VQVFEPSTGGVPVHVEHLSVGLAERGWDVTVVGPGRAAALWRLAAVGIAVEPLELRHLPHPGDLRAASKVAGLCRCDRTIVHAHGTKAGLLAALAARRARAPSVYTPHAWMLERAGSVSARSTYAAYDRTVVRAHRAILAVSKSDREVALRHRLAAPGRIHVVNNGLPPAARIAPDRMALGLPVDAFIACWVGRNAPQKRPEDLAPLARALSVRHITLVALGVGLPGSLHEAAIRAAGGVVLGGDTEPSSLYAASDVLVSTSAWEGHPLCVLEAMRAGLPVVAYAVGGIPEQVKDGESGCLVPPGAVEDVATRIAELRDDEVVRTRMGAAARIEFTRHFTVDRMVDGVEAVYERIGR